MARKIYHTEGLIISSRPWGEANKLLLIFTSQFGLLSVLAQGVRASHSKMRYHLYHFTPLKLSLVRGRETWRLTGVEVMGTLPPPPVRVILIRLGRLLKRLLPETAPACEAYALVSQGTQFLNLLATQPEAKTKLEAGELLLVLRLLSQLGYLPRLQILPPAVWQDEWEDKYLAELLAKRREAISLINQALASSQL
ncbi:MAG: recombination protein O N-terminal domain-containing protein [bacterium]|nr:recombination protein O N-terminal domain-containing protein [bacterium]